MKHTYRLTTFYVRDHFSGPDKFPRQDFKLITAVKENGRLYAHLQGKWIQVPDDIGTLTVIEKQEELGNWLPEFLEQIWT